MQHASPQTRASIGGSLHADDAASPGRTVTPTGDGAVAAVRKGAGRRRAWRRWLFGLLSIALVAFAASQLTSVSAIGADFSGADLRWLAVAAALQVVFFLLYGGLYKAGLAAVEVESRALHLVPVLLASIFAKTVLPLTAAPAAAVFIDDATARGQSGHRTAVAMIVVLVADLVTAMPFVLAGALALVGRSTLVGFALIGTGLFAAFIAVLVLGLVLAARRPAHLAGLLGILGAGLNRFLVRIGRTAIVPDDWGRQTTLQLVDGVTAVPRHPLEIAVAVAFGLAIHVVNLAGLAALFLAFGQPLDPAALAAGFGMGIVFFILSIVPDGIGAVEGAMALVFVALGMAPAAAIVVTVAYRALNIWIPVVVGFAFARRVRLFGGAGAGRAPDASPEPVQVAAVAEPGAR